MRDPVRAERRDFTPAPPGAVAVPLGAFPFGRAGVCFDRGALAALPVFCCDSDVPAAFALPDDDVAFFDAVFAA